MNICKQRFLVTTDFSLPKTSLETNISIYVMNFKKEVHYSQNLQN